jgi:hypothetical protein
MRMLVDGDWVDVADVRVDEIGDKATGELIEIAPHGSALDLTCAIEVAQGGQLAMAAMPWYRRAANALQAEHTA